MITHHIPVHFTLLLQGRSVGIGRLGALHALELIDEAITLADDLD